MQTARGSDPTLPRAELDLRTEEYKHGSARHSSLCKDPPHPRIWCNSCPRVWYADFGSPRDRTGNQDRISDRKRGAYVCPNGKLLQTSGTVHDGHTLLYRASKRDCDVCPIRAKCCTTADARKIPRDLHEDARDIARRKMK